MGWMGDWWTSWGRGGLSWKGENDLVMMGWRGLLGGNCVVCSVWGYLLDAVLSCI